MTIKLSPAFIKGTKYMNGEVTYTTYKDDSLTAAWRNTAKQLNNALKEYGKQYSKETKGHDNKSFR